MFRFSLAALLGLVSFAALGCAALVNATDLWRQTILTLTVCLLLTATLAAIIWRGERRNVAIGSAVFGWAYILLMFVSALGLRDDLLTDKSLAGIYHAAHGTDQQQIEYLDQVIAFSEEGGVVVRGAGSGLRLWDATRRRDSGTARSLKTHSAVTCGSSA
jgi:hypothetical protein